ncbi:MAG: hypothetical protein PHO70_03675 [Candidatus Omnitrophica bacterium]|nr:hypothetical protein [Candidatus Omnitrophota bacterium]
MNNKFDKIERLLGRIFISIIAVVIVFTFCEILARVRFSSYPIMERFSSAYLTLKPYVMVGCTKNIQIEDNEYLNSLGYRGKLPEKEKKPGEYRIFMLGGSTVFEGKPPIPALLENEFKKSGFKGVNVYNFGIIAGASSQELASILFEISDFKPDLIIMYDGNNDMNISKGFDPRPGYPFNFLVYENNPLIKDNLKGYPAFTYFIFGSTLLRHSFPSYFVHTLVPLDKLRKQVNYLSSEWKDAIVTTYVNNLIKAEKVSGAFGADFIAFFQPTLAFKNILSPNEKKNSEVEDRLFEFDMRKRLFLELKNNNFGKLIDLSDIYKDYPDWVFTDTVHTRQEAKQLVTKEIYKHVLPLIEKTVKPDSGG